MLHFLLQISFFILHSLNLSKNMDVFDQFADQFSRLPMFFMAFHGQESIDKVINVSRLLFNSFIK